MSSSMLPQKAKKSHPGHDERLNVPEIGKKNQQRSQWELQCYRKKSHPGHDERLNVPEIEKKDQLRSQ
jgi:hypothetical protein